LAWLLGVFLWELKKEGFIESLTHDSYVIQIAQLRSQHKTELEQLLAIFDQHQCNMQNQHLLDLNEANYPTKYHRLIGRLQRAIADQKVRQKMNLEDDMLEALQDMERALAKKDQIIVEQDRIIAELKK